MATPTKHANSDLMLFVSSRSCRFSGVSPARAPDAESLQLAVMPRLHDDVRALVDRPQAGPVACRRTDHVADQLARLRHPRVHRRPPSSVGPDGRRALAALAPGGAIGAQGFAPAP